MNAGLDPGPVPPGAVEKGESVLTDITKPELEQALIRLAEITGNGNNYYPALADDIFRYVEGQRHACPGVARPFRGGAAGGVS